MQSAVIQFIDRRKRWWLLVFGVLRLVWLWTSHRLLDLLLECKKRILDSGNDCLVVLLIVPVQDVANLPAHHALQLAYCLRHGLIMTLCSSHLVCNFREWYDCVHFNQLLGLCFDCQFIVTERVASSAAFCIIAALSLSGDSLAPLPVSVRAVFALHFYLSNNIP